MSIIIEVTSKETTETWLNILQDSGIPYGPVNNISQTFSHPQVIHRSMIQEVNHPVVGKIKLIGPAVKYSDTPCTIRSPPPLLGQHTRHVLQEICKFDQDEISDLIRNGAVSVHEK